MNSCVAKVMVLYRPGPITTFCGFERFMLTVRRNRCDHVTQMRQYGNDRLDMLSLFQT